MPLASADEGRSGTRQASPFKASSVDRTSFAVSGFTAGWLGADGLTRPAFRVLVGAAVFKWFWAIRDHATPPVRVATT